MYHRPHADDLRADRQRYFSLRIPGVAPKVTLLGRENFQTCN